MKLLRDFEAGLGTVVEGTFGAVFRSPVQPAELARAAAKEMTRSRKLGLGKQHVANVYFVFISPKDGENMGDLAPTIEGELESYLLAFARERDYSFVTRPVVRFTIDENLKRQGKFDIIGQQMTAEAIYAEMGSVAGVTDDIETAQYRPSPPAEIDPLPGITPEPMPDLVINDPATTIMPAAIPASIRVGSVVLPDRGEIELDPQRKYITGRQSTCDLPVADANISRQHAEFSWDGEGWTLRDLGSTNGTSVNGQRIGSSIKLQDGDRITLGISSLTYHESSRMA